MADDRTREAWGSAAIERARAYWTAERLEELSAGRALLLSPAEHAPLLRAIGLLHRDASMPPHCLRKYWQVTHALRILESLVSGLEPQGREPVRIIDAGCGRSYLSLALVARARATSRPIEVLGVERKEGIVRAVARRAQLAGIDAQFRAAEADLAAIDALDLWREAFGQRPDRIDGVIALHACDTATCDAILLGLALEARFLALAPCCQAELAQRWALLAQQPGKCAFTPVHKAPHLSRQIAAHTTDLMRTLLMRAEGYAVTPMEFVGSEHTPKNTLLRAVRTGILDSSAQEEHRALVEATGGADLALTARIRERSSRPYTTDR